MMIKFSWNQKSNSQDAAKCLTDVLTIFDVIKLWFIIIIIYLCGIYLFYVIMEQKIVNGNVINECVVQ